MNEFPRYWMYLDALAIRDQAYAQIILISLLMVSALVVVRWRTPRLLARYSYVIPVAFYLFVAVAVADFL